MEQYVTLFSNSNNDYFINSPDHFKVKLPRILRFVDNWKVGLSEIHYNKTWFNIPESQSIKIILYNHIKNEEHDCILPEGYYTIDKLCQGINVVMKNCLKIEKLTPKLKYNKELDKIVVTFGVDSGRQIFVKFSHDLYHILGIDKRKFEKRIDDTLKSYFNKTEELRKMLKNENIFFTQQNAGNVTYIADKTFDITGGYHSFFLYTDIIKPTFVGNSLSPLMKIVEIPSNKEFGDKISIKYPNIQYFPLENNEIDAVEIKMVDDLGKAIKFVGESLTIVKLHFIKS